ncbi:MAG: methyltransferase [Planctomycetota bacterium]
MVGGVRERIRQQYTAWPYPRVPLLARVPGTHPWQLHCDYLWDRSGAGPAPARPRLWLAGCGTFQPYVFGLANPRAEIVATDLSEPSLELARRRCRLHGVRHVEFAPCDLEDESTWPAGEFDLIECYGVLMNLRDPAAALRSLGRRLSPGGVLRLMVYPQFSRTRIFQLQRLATLLGMDAGEPDHPRRFRAAVRGLPRAHPLRWAFANYADSRNDAGVVDAFLHAGDRGFTGAQLGALIERAGLAPAFWFHRQWAQPAVMAERLGMQDRSQSFVLGYLDLWHELRQNFVVCLRRRDAAVAAPGPVRAHPLFATAGAPLRQQLALLRLRLCGGRVPTRTGAGDVVLRADEARALAAGAGDLPPAAAERLRHEGLLLGGPPPATPLPPHDDLAGEDAFVRRSRALRVGRRAPNPLYAHLFAAYECDRELPAAGLPDLETQLGRWLPWAEPLEQRPIAFGLSPYGTALRFRQNLCEHLARAPLPVADGWHAVRLRDDAEHLSGARAFAFAHVVCPDARAALDDAALRELWVLAFGHEDLFTTLLPA